MSRDSRPRAPPRSPLVRCLHHEAKVNAEYADHLEDRARLRLAATAIFVLPVEAGLERIYVRFAPDGRVHCVHFRPGDQTISPRPAGW
jgi:hypothetical protein